MGGPQPREVSPRPPIDFKNWPQTPQEEIELLKKIGLSPEKYGSIKDILPNPPQELVQSWQERAKAENKAPIQLALEKMNKGHSIFEVWAAISAVDDLPETVAAAMMSVACRHRQERLRGYINDFKQSKVQHTSEKALKIFAATLQQSQLLTDLGLLFQEWASLNSKKGKKVA